MARSADKAAQPLPDEVADSLMRQIQDGALATGALLPSERELVSRLGVSRPVVREALARLRSEGFVVARQGKGAYVAAGGRQSFRVRDVALDGKAAQAHILELLIAVEVAATRLAATRRTPEELKRIGGALLGMQRAIASRRLGDEEDYAFHKAIVDATHNPHFQALNEHLEHSVRRLIRQARSNTAKNLASLVEDVQKEHEAIYAAVAARDATAAAAAAERHLRNAARRLDRYLKSSRRRSGRAQ